MLYVTNLSQTMQVLQCGSNGNVVCLHNEQMITQHWTALTSIWTNNELTSDHALSINIPHIMQILSKLIKLKLIH